MEIISVIFLFIVGVILVIASKTMDDLDLKDSADSTYSEYSILVIFISWIGKKMHIRYPVKFSTLIVGLIMIIGSILWAISIY